MLVLRPGNLWSTVVHIDCLYSAYGMHNRQWTCKLGRRFLLTSGKFTANQQKKSQATRWNVVLAHAHYISGCVIMGSAQWICRCSLLSIYTSRWRMSEHRQRRLIKNEKKTRTLWWRADFLMSISSFSMFCLVFSPPTLFFSLKDSRCFSAAADELLLFVHSLLSSIHFVHSALSCNIVPLFFICILRFYLLTYFLLFFVILLPLSSVFFLISWLHHGSLLSFFPFLVCSA